MKNKKIKKNFFIKRGSFINKNLSIMDFLYIGSGVHIDKNVTIEPYVLIGDGVQIKKNVYLSALSQIGGFLISKDFFPTIIEENANIGRHCRIYENIIIKRGAIIESGVSIAKNSLIYDIVNRKKIKSKNNNILTIPENAIVVPGNKCNNSNYAKKKGISLYNSIIIKYIKNI
jgi:2,3,4,5-tetrahydropyridine-2-carboxylate N-succinyltransferase